MSNVTTTQPATTTPSESLSEGEQLTRVIAVGLAVFMSILFIGWILLKLKARKEKKKDDKLTIQPNKNQQPENSWEYSDELDSESYDDLGSSSVSSSDDETMNDNESDAAGEKLNDDSSAIAGMSATATTTHSERMKGADHQMERLGVSHSS
mmetsp:Transcript_6506/g.7065  ORF Transcript_6506/g.7065 Transcript_6506/m.7065 type:complete len:152 (-) Transcript_6506:56-511(-)